MSEAIAVLGAGLRLPGDIEDLASLWRFLHEGRSALSPLQSSPDGRRSPCPQPDPGGARAGLLSQVDSFDAEFFGITAAEARYIDPQQRIALEVAWETLEDAGVPAGELSAAKTGVFLGLYGSDYMSLQLERREQISAYTAPGSAHSIAANRLSYALDLRGPSIAVDTACSSSLVALHLACRSLRSGECDLALAGGVNLILSELSSQVTERVLPISPSGRCRTFDAGADGIVRGEGCVIFLLERAERARRRPRALITGSAVNQDGRTNGLTAPNPEAQREVIEDALEDAAADPGEVLYVEAHGTGTPLGDPIEVAGLREVYGRDGPPCALGSVKTNFGHIEAAAGAVGLLKAMLVLEHGRIPPHLHLEQLNPEIELAGTRLTIPSDGAALPAVEGRRLAAVSSFGFGGTNAHVVIEAASDETAARRCTDGAERRPAILAISARSEPALRLLAEDYLASLGTDAGELELCAAAALNRTHHAHRICVHGSGAGELAEQLERASRTPRGPSTSKPRVAFVFSGQGTQWQGMGRELLAGEPVARAEIEACDEIVRELAGWSVIEQLQAEGARSRIEQTEVAQLSIASLQLGLASLVRSWGVHPAAVTGHSMGEVVAACACGVLGRAQALELLLHRARIVEAAARGGRMGSLATTPEQVRQMIETAAGPGVCIAAENSPRSTVISGHAEAVAEVASGARSRGVRVRELPVEYAFHSTLLESGAAELARLAAELTLHEPHAALYSTVTGESISAARLDGSHWGRNLRQPVLFSRTICSLARDGISMFVEFGPHPVLQRDIAASLESVGAKAGVTASLRRDRPPARALAGLLGELYCAGAEVEWGSIFESPRVRVSLPRHPWRRRRHWLADVPGADELDVDRPAASAMTSASMGAEEITAYLLGRILLAGGFEDPGLIPLDRPLESLGIESLAIVELKNEVERDLGIAVPLSLLLEEVTLSELAVAVGELLQQASPTVQAVS